MTSDVHSLTITEAARELDIAPATLRRWVARGHISVIKHPSGRMRVPLDEVSRVNEPHKTSAAHVA